MSGRSSATWVSAASPLAGLGHHVAAGAKLRLERPPDLPFVVDHEDAGHGALRPVVSRQRDRHREPAARRVVERQRAAHRVDEPLGDRQPEPDAVAVGRVAEPLERQGHSWPIDRLIPMPRSTTRRCTRWPISAASIRHRGVGRTEPQRVRDDVGEAAFEQRRIARAPSARSSGISTRIDAVRRTDAVDRGSRRSRRGRRAGRRRPARRSAAGWRRAGCRRAGSGDRSPRRR